MASDNTRKLMRAKVLSSARAANILDENDSDGVKGLIADYFATVSAVEGEDAVDGEDESNQDLCHVPLTDQSTSCFFRDRERMSE